MTSAHKKAIEDLCARMSRLQLEAFEPLERFEPFPRLPKELRRLIFKFALPSDTQMITVKAFCRILMPKKRIHVFFLVPEHKPGMLPQSTEFKDVRLTQVCWEAREVFLEKNKGCLPGERKSMMYFDPKNTPLFIQNYAVLAKNIDLREAFASGSWKPKWIEEITRLAIGEFSGKRWLRKRNDVGEVSPLVSLQAFQSLTELWIGIHCNCGSLVAKLNTPEDYERIRAKAGRHFGPDMNSWADQFTTPSYVMPKPHVMFHGVCGVGLDMYPHDL